MKRAFYFLIICLILILNSIAFITYIVKMREKTFINCKTNLEKIYVEIKDKFIYITNLQFERLSLIDSSDSKNKDFLLDYRDEMSLDNFYFINKNQEFYDIDNNFGKLEMGQYYDDLFIDNKNTIIKIDDELLFLIPSNGTIDGFSYNSIALSYSQSYIINDLMVSSYESNADIFVTNAFGLIAYASKNDFKENNFIDYLKNIGLKENKINDLLIDLKNGNKSTIKFHSRGKSMYLVYLPMGIQNTSIVSIIPAGIVEKDIKSIQTLSTGISISVFMIVLFGIITLGIYFYKKNIKNKNDEIAWRDTLSNVVMETLDNVYIMFNNKNNRVVYVSPNIERLFGIKRIFDFSIFKKIELIEECKISYDEIFKLDNMEHIEDECWINNKEKKLFHKSALHIKQGFDDLFIFEYQDYSKEYLIRSQIEDALRASREANNSKNAFLSNISHDIRTPLNAICGLSRLLKDTDNLEKKREYINKIDDSSKYLLSLINDILDISRIESGIVNLSLEKFDLCDQIDQIRAIAQSQMINKNQEFNFSINIKNKMVIGDSTRLRQILINILSNASKYTNENGKISFRVIEIETRENSAKYLFSIIDNGIGMDEDFIKNKIFDPFTRENNSFAQGTGLGMAITKNLIDLMHGAISIESKINEGSKFDVALELKLQSKIDIVKNKNIDIDNLRGLRALCAEDNLINAEIIEEVLKGLGIKCKVLNNGKDLINEFENQEYDLILMDVKMPIMNGLEATKYIRNNSKNPLAKAIPIIAMTANAFINDIRLCLDAGMNDHISKPIDIDDLKMILLKYCKK